MIIQFVQLTEVNDHEGEEWRFWLQLTGNENEIDKLRSLLSETEANSRFDLAYTLGTSVEPEPVVDKLVQYAIDGYNKSHNKVVGVFTCPDALGENANDLYKGGINDYFTAVSP